MTTLTVTTDRVSTIDNRDQVRSLIVVAIKDLQEIQALIHTEPELFFMCDGDGNCLADRVNQAIVRLAKIGYNL